MELAALTRGGDLDSLKEYFDNHTVTSEDYVSGGVSIAHWAASGESTKVLEFILQKLPSLLNHHSAEDGATPLHWAAQDNREENIKFLLSKDCEISVDSMGETALHLAAMNGFLPIVQLLVSYKPSIVNIKSVEGNTALHLATLNSHKRIIAYLLSQGAEPDDPNNKGDTPRNLAVAKKDRGFLDYFDPEKLQLIDKIVVAEELSVKLAIEVANIKAHQIQETREREAAVTQLKATEDQLFQYKQDIAKRDSQISVLEYQLQTRQSQIERLESELLAAHAKNTELAAIISAQNESPQPISSQNAISDSLLNKVRAVQDDLQKLHKTLELTESTLLLTKTSVNSLADSLTYN